MGMGKLKMYKCIDVILKFDLLKILKFQLVTLKNCTFANDVAM